MATDLSQAITDLENQTWQALQKSGAELLPFLTTDCAMLFPLGMKVSHTTVPSLTDVMTSEAFIPWSSYKMFDVEVVPVGEDGAVITYKAEAIRSNSEPQFRALCSSIWKKSAQQQEGRWLLCLHQQTPYTLESLNV